MCFHHKSYKSLLDITSFRQSCAINLKDRITPMMVILFMTFSPPKRANEMDQCSLSVYYVHLSTKWSMRALFQSSATMQLNM